MADHSPNFTLSYSDAHYGTYYLSVERNRLVTSDEDEKSTWVLLPREYQGVGTVHLCVAFAGIAKSKADNLQHL